MRATKAARYNRIAMQIKDLGEFGVIELLNSMIVERRAENGNAAASGFRLLVDTGDDTAAWEAGSGIELFTTDTVVEGVHFTRFTTPWKDLGWKALASNISDIAAMGGLPLYALVTLGLPPETDVEDIRQLYLGMLEISNEYGVAIVGGDMVRSPVAFITVGLTGVNSTTPMLRSSARLGDQVAVTGFLGGSGGGLKLMLEHQTMGSGQVSQGATDEATPEEMPKAMDEAAEYLRQCHRRPVPAVEEGLMLAGAGVKAAMDVSDGLSDDLSKLCLASGLSARVHGEQIPVHPLLMRAFPNDFLDLALYGGEDYLLLFTAEPALMSQVMANLPQGAVVGELVAGEPGRVVIVDAAGRETVARRSGWDHFA